MPRASRSRRKTLRKISLEELMGAAGMSGFAALLERAPETLRPEACSSALSLQAAGLASRIEEQDRLLASVQATFLRRQTSLGRALEILVAVKNRRPLPSPLLGAAADYTLITGQGASRTIE